MGGVNNTMIVFDLDDTLYKEYNYVHSGYLAVAQFITNRTSIDFNTALNILWNAWKNGKNAFDAITEYLTLNISECNIPNISQMLEIYRTHKPNITLDNDTIKVLDTLIEQGYTLGIITDGDGLRQQLKIDALGLSRWFDNINITISGNIGVEKPNTLPYRTLMQRNCNISDFIYVGDNLTKDFAGARICNWRTICLRDVKQCNIHKQNFDNTAPDYMPNMVINDITELPNAINTH